MKEPNPLRERFSDKNRERERPVEYMAGNEENRAECRCRSGKSIST